MLKANSPLKESEWTVLENEMHLNEIDMSRRISVEKYLTSKRTYDIMLSKSNFKCNNFIYINEECIQ